MSAKPATLIDSPSPLASLAEWEAFARKMEPLAATDASAASELRGARAMIAEIKAEERAEQLRRSG